MMLGPRIHSSPGSPSLASSVSSMTSRASRLGSNGPMLPILVRKSFAGSKCDVGDVSVRP